MSATEAVRNNPHCLVCNARVGVSTRTSHQIFNKQVTTCSERPVTHIMSKVLETELAEENVHSLLVCKKCFKLFDEADELEIRLSEIKSELLNNYKKSERKNKYGEEDDKEEDENMGNIKTEDNKENQMPKKILDIPSSDDETQQTAKNSRIIEDIEMELEKIHGNSDEKPAIKEDTSVTIMSESGTYQGAFTVIEETVDAGAIDNSDDSDYEPNMETDNTEALLEAAAMAEESLDKVKIKIEPGLGDPSRLLKRKSNAGRKPMPKPKIKEEYLPPIVARDGSIYTCLVCDGDETVCGDAKSIMSHVKMDHDMRVYICDVCGQDFRKRPELSVHLDEHVAAEEGDFQCEVCNRIFSNLRLFRIHKRMHYPQAKLWTCEMCGKSYSSKNLLEEHTNTHTGRRPYVCNLCGKDFASKYTFRAHEKTHEVRPRPFQCQLCPKSFLSQQNLTQHERTHSGIKEYECHLCGKAFGSPHNLEVHSIVHTGYKPYICGTCGKAFARKAEIRDHERIHTGERPYQCEFCGATFSQRSNLQSHKRATHYDDKRYKCHDCGKGFKRRRLLDYHVKAAHTGERPFKCGVCDATFVYPEHFKKHRRIHTGEKPFLCEVCGKAFNSRDNRNAHRFVHSDKKPYECLVCGAGFMRKPLLYQHMQSQGHLNDTIVVNQPRLTTDDDQIITVNADGEMEIVENGEVRRLETIDGDDDELYITELKEPVLVQGSDVFGNSKGSIIVSESLDEDNDGDEGVEHIIIDAQQVHFKEDNEEEMDEDDENQMMSEQFLDPNGDYEEIVADGIEGETRTFQTSEGPIQLVQVRIPNSDGEEEEAWIKLAT